MRDSVQTSCRGWRNKQEEHLLSLMASFLLSLLSLFSSLSILLLLLPLLLSGLTTSSPQARVPIPLFLPNNFL
ncbi:hypothetical protein RJ641_027317 [Dillenia turbinata]|uniref:Uncharacterized protein n=1 Tax=Dillenia turbinata TaxID=194707 RepID=A0AAN8ZQ83_9MAGN